MSLCPLRAPLSRILRGNRISSCPVLSVISRPQRSIQFHTCAVAFATEVPNQPPQTKLAETRLRRFWRLVSVEKGESIYPLVPSVSDIDGYIISLDSKPLRTPLGNTIVLPARLSTLAYLIGAEWNVVTTGSVRQHTLPLTSLVCRAVDQLTPETPKEIRSAVIESLLRYLDTDAVLFFAPESQAHGQLLRMQTEEWTPIIRWAEKAFQVSIHSRSGEVGIGQFAKQPVVTREKFRSWMQSYFGPLLEMGGLTGGVGLMRSNCLL